ncbi:MAG: cobalamin-binding protein [Acidobacteriota bacterium]
MTASPERVVPPGRTVSPRVVSLVPGGTEILFALGAGATVVGVSHECDHPPAAANLPSVTTTSLSAGSTPAEIDQAVRQAVATTTPLATLDEGLLRRLRPEVIVTQDLCPVCAVDESQLAGLAACPTVVSLAGGTLEGVFRDIQRTAEALGRPDAATELIANLRRRLRNVSQTIAHRRRPRLVAVALEWLDPLFLGGHWVPEMFAWAGAEDALVEAGEPSRRTDWKELAAADPDALVIMPCGFDEVSARRQMTALIGLSEWRALRAVRQGRVYPVDANGLFSRPGPRLVDGVEHLARLLHGPPA